MQAPDPSARPGLAFILFFGLLPPLFIGFGIFLLTMSAPKLIEGWSARSWPSVHGRVTEVRLEEVQHDRGKKRWFEVTVGYTFDVAGRPYSGDRLGLWPERLQRLDAQALAAGFPVGLPVMAHYNPSDPTRSLLDRSVGIGTWAVVGIGTLALGVGMALLVSLVRMVRLARLGVDHARQRPR
ncbi:MAG: DUF3592 domain-containing protein [Aquabacterium sp.]